MKKPECRQFKQVVIKGHGWHKSPKDTKETDICITEPSVVNEFTSGMIFYLMVDDYAFPKIDIKHPALTGKVINGMAIDGDSMSIVVFVK